MYALVREVEIAIDIGLRRGTAITPIVVGEKQNFYIGKSFSRTIISDVTFTFTVVMVSLSRLQEL